MKKKNLKSLELNKKSISRFEQEDIKGGRTILTKWLTEKVTETISYIYCD